MKDHQPKKIKDGIVSVRSQKTGKGSALRVFVDIQKMLCFSDRCLSKYSTISAQDRNSAWCEHLKEGISATETSREITIKIESLKDLNLEKEIIEKVRNQSENGLITCYEVNKHTVVTPTFASISVCGVVGLTHVRDLICKIKDCKSIKTQHALAKKTEKICLHNLLVMKCGIGIETKVSKEVISKIDHVKTVNILLANVDIHFPSLSEAALKDFLPKNKVFVDKLR